MNKNIEDIDDLNDMEEKVLYFPNVNLISAQTTLEKNEIIYARLLKFEWVFQEEKYFLLSRERQQLPIEEYLEEEQIEVLLEIIDGDIVLSEDEEGKRVSLPDGYIEATFLSLVDSYLFFAILVDFMNSQIDDYDEEVYDWLATEVFTNYGKNGFGIDPYSSYYMVETENGTFLLNEYIFGEQVEDILPGTKVGLKIEETLLLSINKYTPPDLTFKLTEEEKRKLALHQERLAAYEAMQERIRIRRANGEGPSLV